MPVEDENINGGRSDGLLSGGSVEGPEASGIGEQLVSHPSSPPVKLCGYLNKLTGKGPLRGFRSRWFVFESSRCLLYYFKCPQDGSPLGFIDIAGASFSYEVQNPEEPVFQIHSGGQEHHLKAHSKEVMLYWLQQLQQKRWEYCNSRGTTKRNSHADLSQTVQEGFTGLVGKDTGCASVSESSMLHEMARNVLDTQTAPGQLVGENAANHPAPTQHAAVNFSLRQLGTEIRNSMLHLRPGRGSNENRRSVFYTSNDEWEMIDNPKDLEEAALAGMQDYGKRSMSEGSKGLMGLNFTFETGRMKQNRKTPFLRELIGSNKNSHGSSESSSVGWISDSGNESFSEMQQKIQRQQEEVEKLKDELSDQKELVHLLQQTLRSCQYDRHVFSAMTDGNLPESLEMLLHKDSQILSLSNHLEKQGLEKDSLHHEVKTLKLKIGELNEQLEMLKETIQAKDEVIVKMSHEANESDRKLSTQNGSDNTIISPVEEIDRLKDTLQGYIIQNKFLNKEILELSVLRRNSEEREKALEAKYASLEAKLCQTESKYLVLLQEVKNPICSGEQANTDIISRLVEDALKVDNAEHLEQAVLKPHPLSEYDSYGFQTISEEDDEEKLVAKARALELKTLSLTDSQEASNGVKWENYFANNMNRDMVRGLELKNLIRCGIPQEYRSKVWRWCVHFHTKKIREEKSLNYFLNLLQQGFEKQNPASKQIELDLMRTLPNNKYYASPTSDGIQKLRNVLVAFSWRNPDIGYCQGLNRLAAVALLFLDQEDAFWCLVTIVEIFMPRDYYTKTLLGSQVDQRVFKDFMIEKLPRLHAHFEHHKVDYSLITFNWFLVVFVDSVVSDILFKIWDSFLYEGPKIIFRYALALFKYKEDEILKQQDSVSIFKHLRYFTRTILDGRKLNSIAFAGMNPFRIRQIHNRRNFHLLKVQQELKELEDIRQDFLRDRESHLDRGNLISDDEEEDN